MVSTMAKVFKKLQEIFAIRDTNPNIFYKLTFTTSPFLSPPMGERAG